jgi:hypothetical protein
MIHLDELKSEIAATVDSPTTAAPLKKGGKQNATLSW